MLFMISLPVGEVIANHENTGYKEIYTGVEYFKIYAMDSVNHDFKYDFIVTDTAYAYGNKELNPLKMLSLVRQALRRYVYVAYDRSGYFEDFWHNRPFQTKSISISAKVLFILPIAREDLADIGVEGIYHFYTNMQDDSDNFVSNKWRKTSKIEKLSCIPDRLDRNIWNDGELELLKEM